MFRSIHETLSKNAQKKREFSGTFSYDNETLKFLVVGKMMAIVLAMIMVLMYSVPAAFAAGTATNTADTYTITIKNNKTETNASIDGHTFSAYLVLQDGELHSLSEVRDRIAADMNLSDDDLNEMLPSGKQSTFYNRVAWASVLAR